MRSTSPRRSELRAVVGVCVALFVAAAVACGSSDDGGAAAAGGERQACYPNGTCNAGLSCLSQVCVNEGTDASVSDEAAAVDSAMDSAKDTSTPVVDAAEVDASDGGGGCTLSLDVQPIFNAACAVTGCHVNPMPPAGMLLDSTHAWAMLVNVTSEADATYLRVKPGDPESSYLYRAMTGRPAPGHLAQPPPGATIVPTAEQKARVQCWIQQGAPQN